MNKNTDTVNTMGKFFCCTVQWLQLVGGSIPPKEGFQWGSGGWEAEACTPPARIVLLRYFGGLCSTFRLVSMVFVVDLKHVAKLNFFMRSAVACRVCLFGCLLVS
jgi:hypothetical protein